MAAPTYSSANSPNPGECYAAVTPSDVTVLSPLPRAFYIGGAGNLVLQDPGGGDTTFTAVPAGSILPVRAAKVKAATTATGIVAIY